jgi:hypothetical protein
MRVRVGVGVVRAFENWVFPNRDLKLKADLLVELLPLLAARALVEAVGGIASAATALHPFEEFDCSGRDYLHIATGVVSEWFADDWHQKPSL